MLTKLTGCRTSTNKTCDIRDRVIFVSQRHILNKLGRRSQDDATNIISRPIGFRGPCSAVGPILSVILLPSASLGPVVNILHTRAIFSNANILKKTKRINIYHIQTGTQATIPLNYSRSVVVSLTIQAKVCARKLKVKKCG